MRANALFLIVGLMGAPAFAAAQQRPSSQVVQQDRLRATEVVKAATNSAINGLYDEISSQPLSSQYTVGQFLQVLEAKDDFITELYRCDQIGAPRWVNDQTCQVQLQIATTTVQRGLVRIASADPKRTPVSALQIQRATARWPRSFIATGSATSDQVIRFRPNENVAWRAVNEAARQKALVAAKTDAARHAMQSVSAVVLADSKTLGDTFAIREVGEAVDSWLSRRPVTRVDFKDDLQVEVSLGVDQRDFLTVVREAIKRQGQIQLPPADSKDWQRVERDFASRFSAAVGRASCVGGAAPRAVAQLPATAPEWVTQTLSVDGQATGAGPRLQTRAQAQRDAAAKLQARLEGLSFGQTTVGEVARQNPRVARAITLTINQARLSTEYRDGAVVVHLSSDLRDFWDQLRRALPQ